MTVSFKLDSQLARAFKEYERRSKLTRSQAGRRLLRVALGIEDADGEAQEEIMEKIANHNRRIGTAAARR